MSQYRSRLAMDLLATFASGLGALLIFAGLSSPARPFVVLIGLLIGTGWGITGWVKLPADAAYVGAITIALGFAVPIGYAVILLNVGSWHPLADTAVLLSVAAAVNLAQSMRDAREASAV